MSDYYDAREIRSPESREEALLAALPQTLDHAIRNAPAMAVRLKGVDPDVVRTRDELARLPVLRKHDLLTGQTEGRARTGDALGGFAAPGWRNGRRIFASPGPLYEPESARPDYWRFARALYAAGFRAGDLVHNGFAYHFTPAGAMVETAAHALGCSVFPAGTGQTEQQVRTMQDLRPAGYAGTPSFLKLLLEKADELGIALPSLRKALVSGEAFAPSMRNWLADRGVAGYQAYGSADVGLIAYETPARDGLVMSEDLILEIVRPGTGDPVPEGEVGEIVVTTLNPDYPLVRFGTGDLSAILPGCSPCGRTNQRIRGWLGRADQTTKVRGMFVHPSQIADIVRRHPELGRARLIVRDSPAGDAMDLYAETDGEPEGLAMRVAATARELTKLRADVHLVARGSLVNDGKVIEDARQYH